MVKVGSREGTKEAAASAFSPTVKSIYELTLSMFVSAPIWMLFIFIFVHQYSYIVWNSTNNSATSV